MELVYNGTLKKIMPTPDISCNHTLNNVMSKLILLDDLLSVIQHVNIVVFLCFETFSLPPFYFFGQKLPGHHIPRTNLLLEFFPNLLLLGTGKIQVVFIATLHYISAYELENWNFRHVS